MTRILITGVAGHLGSRLAKWILDNVPEVEIFGLDDLSCGYEENVPPEVTWLKLSLGREAYINGLRDLDYVFHLAAYAAEGRSPFLRKYNYENNLGATAQVVNHCIEHGCQRLVYTSSMAVYGNGWAPFSERDNCRPHDPYGNAKLASERDIEIAGEQHGLDYCIIRPHNIYGPYQDIWTPYRNVLGIWMSRTLRGLPLCVYGDGTQRRAFSFIDDCLPSMWRAAVAPKASRQIINLGGAMEISILETAKLVLEVMGGGELIHEQPRHEVQQAWCTTHRSIDLLDYRESTDLRAGVEAMWLWAQDAWERYPQRRVNFDRYGIQHEITTGLYSYWR